jgi:hypothetical protein
MTEAPRPVLLPEGTRLLHIGPHKTGTTTMQAAFHQNRESLTAQGIHYAGNRAHPMSAVMAAASGRVVPSSQPDAGLNRWNKLVEEVRGSDARAVVLSSEFFCEADDTRVRAILDDLGAETTHVVITLRPLIRILGSQWQQYMQNRMVISYETWLDAMLNKPDDGTVTPSFWKRHRHDRLVRRWAEAVGVDNLTVIVVDESDRRMLVRTFEQLLGLTDGTLEPRDPGANRSLTYAEVELLRAFNRSFLDHGWSHADYTKLVRFGAARHLQERRPGPGEARVLTPAWAVERGSAIGAEMVENIRASGVRVIGSLDTLADPALAPAVGDNPEHVEIPAEVAARFAAGLVNHLADIPGRAAPPSRSVGGIESIIRTRHQRLAAEGASYDASPPTAVDDASRVELARELGRRIRSRIKPR